MPLRGARMPAQPNAAHPFRPYLSINDSTSMHVVKEDCIINFAPGGPNTCKGSSWPPRLACAELMLESMPGKPKQWSPCRCVMKMRAILWWGMDAACTKGLQPAHFTRKTVVRLC